VNKHIIFICLLICAELFVSAAPAKETAELTKLADGIYARIASPDSNAVGNSGVVVLDHSVLVFDTHFTPEAGEALLAGIRAITPKPVRFVVNSHWHADHTHGNQVFADAQIISSANARRDILELDLPSFTRTGTIAQTQITKLRQEMSKETAPAQIQRLREQIKSREEYLQTASRLKITAPVVAIDDSLTIQDGKQEVRLLYLGTGHTDGDIVLLLPTQKIAFVGDLFFNNAIPNVQDASVLQWMKTLEEVLKLSTDKFIPGHGPVGAKKDVESFLHYLEELKALVQPYVDRGDGMDQALNDIQMPAKYSSWQFPNFFQSNVQKMFAELKSQQLATPPPETAPKPEPKRPMKK
jgi:cyclase